MTRIVGYLEGANGPLNGRLYVKAGGAFIGAPTKDLSFKVNDGIVDIQLPACPPGMPYFVDWKDAGDISRLQYVERWRVLSKDEMSVDEARGFIRSSKQSINAGHRKGDLIEMTMLRNEASELSACVSCLEDEKAVLLRRVSEAESRAAAAQARIASISAELSKAQKQKEEARLSQQETVIEKIVERTITPDEYVEQLSAYREQVELVCQENERLKAAYADTLSLSTHFAGLHAEIDRLNLEKQQLLNRIEALKHPQRSTSSFRNEAIANLDRLLSD